MKKTFLVLLGLFFISFSAFSQGVTKKESKTLDGYRIKLYWIDISKPEYCDSFEFYVQLYSEDSDELFTWCFNKLNEAMMQFRRLENISVVSQNSEIDNRNSWRYHSYDAEFIDTWIKYWIDGHTHQYL